MSKDISKKEVMKGKIVDRQAEAKTIRKIVLISTIALFALVGTAVLAGYLYISSALKPVDQQDKKARDIEIPLNSSVGDISVILENEGIIKNAKVFKYYVKFKNESGFQAGSYKLNPSMKMSKIVASIKSGKVIQAVSVRMTIPEGKQLTQIAGIMAERINHKQEDVLKVLNSKEFVQKMMNLYPNLLSEEILDEKVKYPLEGYLYPATYSFYSENPTVEEMTKEMLTKTDAIVQKYRGEMGDEWTPHTLLTFASLIEEEATDKTDREKIAAVFFNRLKIDMPLQTDPTVLYAQGAHKDRVLNKDLKFESPYNLYMNKGLTPGPIANAGESSIQAVFSPASIDDLYFLATKSGEVIFSKTLEQHNREKAKHITGK